MPSGWREFRTDMRESLRDRFIGVGIAFVLLPIGILIFEGDWIGLVVLFPVGIAILLWIRPWRPRRGHVAWVARVEPDPDDVASGRSFPPFYVPTCECGWEELATDDPMEARREAEKHAEKVELDWRRTHEPVED
jgi:hypothetical protein